MVVDLRVDQEFLFSSDDLDTLTGGSKDDHLYGPAAWMCLSGMPGGIILEGNGGSDRLEGGADRIEDDALKLALTR